MLKVAVEALFFLYSAVVLGAMGNGGSYVTYQTDTGNHIAESTVAVPQGTSGWGLAYADKIREYEKEVSESGDSRDNNSLRYDVIFLDEDNIPELVIDRNGYDVSVFTFHSGTLYTIMDHWAYGAMGNAGYDYLPGKNVIRNYDADQAGAILYITYGKINENYEFESYYEDSLSLWMFKDLNHNGYMDEDEPYSEKGYYYYGDREISEKEFESYTIEGEYENIQGDKMAAEMIAQLEGIAY